MFDDRDKEVWVKIIDGPGKGDYVRLDEMMRQQKRRGVRMAARSCLAGALVPLPLVIPTAGLGWHLLPAGVAAAVWVSVEVYMFCTGGVR